MDIEIVQRAIMALLAVATPFAAFLRPLRELGYGQPAVLAVPGAVSGLIGVFVVLLKRHDLHLFPMVFWPLGVFIIAVVIFIVCAPGGGTTPTRGQQFAGVTLYVVIAFVLAFGITQLAAENLLYYRLHGKVIGLEQGDRTGHQVRLEGVTEGLSLHSPLDSELRYQFLLNESEKDTGVKLRLVEGEKPTKKTRVIHWPVNRTSLNFDLEACL